MPHKPSTDITLAKQAVRHALLPLKARRLERYGTWLACITKLPQATALQAACSEPMSDMAALFDGVRSGLCPSGSAKCSNPTASFAGREVGTNSGPSARQTAC